MNKLSPAIRTSNSMLACCIVAFALCNVVFIFKPVYLLAPRPVPAAPSPFSIRNLTNTRSHAYELKGDIRIHGNSSTVFIATSSSSSSSSSSLLGRWIAKPYAILQFDERYQKPSEFKIRVINNHEALLPCTRNFSIPVLFFGFSPFIGNPYHDMSDNLIPLYLTSAISTLQDSSFSKATRSVPPGGITSTENY